MHTERADNAWLEMAHPRSVIAWRSGRRLGVGDEFTTPHIATRWRVVRVRQPVRGRQGRTVRRRVRLSIASLWPRGPFGAGVGRPFTF